MSHTAGAPAHAAGRQRAGTVVEVELDIEVFAHRERLVDARAPYPVAGKVLVQEVVALDDVAVETAGKVHFPHFFDTLAEKCLDTEIMPFVEVLVGGHRVEMSGFGVFEDFRVAGDHVGAQPVESGERQGGGVFVEHVAQLGGVGDFRLQVGVALREVFTVGVVDERVELVDARARHAARVTQLQRVVRCDVVFDVQGGEEAVVVEVVGGVRAAQVGDGVGDFAAQSRLHAQFFPECVGVDEVGGVQELVISEVVALVEDLRGGCVAHPVVEGVVLPDLSVGEFVAGLDAAAVADRRHEIDLRGGVAVLLHRVGLLEVVGHVEEGALGEGVDGVACALREEEVGGELTARSQEGLLVVDAGLDAFERPAALARPAVEEGGVVGNTEERVVAGVVG